MMVVLDTNVVSEMMKPAGSAAVLGWVDAIPRARLFTTAITQAEILHGIAILPAGRRRDRLGLAATDMFREDFAARILPFDAEAAGHFADIVATRRRVGRPVAAFDGQIAAIARARGARIATRNTGDFDGCGVETVDPWAPA